MLVYKPTHSGGSHYREGLSDSRYKMARGIYLTLMVETSVGMWSSLAVLYPNKVTIIYIHTLQWA